MKITWPTLILSPSLTRISCTVPLTEDGTSTTALSVSNSITDWPALTLRPGDHQADQVALFYVFSQLRKLEFNQRSVLVISLGN